MDRFEINKIIAAIILTIVVVLSLNKLADFIYNVETPKGNTFEVAVVAEKKEADKDDDTKSAVSGSIETLLTLGSIDHGKKIFRQCAACHSVTRDGGNKIGPALWGIIGRKAGSKSDYRYSKSMSELEKNWDFETMNAFLIKPKDYVKGTKMAYAGLKKEKDRASIILYLNNQSDTPLQLP